MIQLRYSVKICLYFACLKKASLAIKSHYLLMNSTADLKTTRLSEGSQIQKIHVNLYEIPE